MRTGKRSSSYPQFNLSWKNSGHTLAEWSWEPVANSASFGEKQIELTGLSWAISVKAADNETQLPVSSLPMMKKKFIIRLLARSSHIEHNTENQKSTSCYQSFRAKSKRVTLTCRLLITYPLVRFATVLPKTKASFSIFNWRKDDLLVFTWPILHSLTVVSSDAEASQSQHFPPSTALEHASELTDPVWPVPIAHLTHAFFSSSLSLDPLQCFQTMIDLSCRAHRSVESKDYAHGSLFFLCHKFPSINFRTMWDSLVSWVLRQKICQIFSGSVAG